MPPKANLNTPPSKTIKRPSSSSTIEKVSRSSTTNDTFIVRPAGSSNDQGTMKIYMNLEVLRSLGLSAGDLVVVTPKMAPRGVVGIITPSGGACIDDIVELTAPFRRYSGILLGDRVSISKYSGRPAVASVVKVKCDDSSASDDSIFLKSSIIKTLKDVRLISPGLRLGSDNASKFLITDTESLPNFDKLSLNGLESASGGPLGSPVYYFDEKSTSLNFVDSASIHNDLSHNISALGYSAIGGLSKQIALLRSKIELPLHQPALFKRFGMVPDRGFLLYGPPGTGKTMLLRAVAHETQAHVLTINGPSIVSKYLGETESALRSIFDEAQRYEPSLIFIDEIDAIVPKRDSDDSGEAESRLVSTLLTLMDGMGASGRVVVIGATNRPNSIDPALRRPGRFGQEIEIGIPDADGRLDILIKQLSTVPNHLDHEFVTAIAGKTHGYVGADLYSLCRDAVMRAIQRGLAGSLDASEMFVEKDDMEKAYVDIRPSAMREIVLETPKVHWTDIGGQEEVKQRLKETVEWPLSHPEAFQRLGIRAPKGILLYGPPGCSKTLIAKALATEAGLNFLAVKGPEIFNKYVGESERSIREIFRKARAAAPSIIFFDEIDALSAARGHGEAGGDRVLTSLLNEIDGIEALNDVTILAATNIPDQIDSALMRPGRLDRLIYVCPPDDDARKQILRIQFQKMSIAEDVNLDKLTELTDGCSGAEIVGLCQEAGLIAMNEDINIEAICMGNFMTALTKIKKIITKEMLEYFEEFSKRGVS
jgi:AAA family ATPase